MSSLFTRIHDDDVCRICGDKASIWNIKGHACTIHKDLLVRDWSKQTLEDLKKEWPDVPIEMLEALMKNGHTY